MNFIRYNIISKILSKYRDNRDLYDHDSFFYFNSEINKIDRIGKGFLYNKDEVVPVDWNNVRGKDLLNILKEMKNKNFFFYKDINGKFYKTRPKRNVKK